MVKLRNIGWIVIIFLGIIPGARAQYNPVQSLFSYNTMYVNPANTGILGKGSVFLWHRTQWAGFEGAPNTAMLSLEYPLKKMAFGATMYYDYSDVLTQTFGAGYFSYLLNLDYATYLSLGLNLGFRKLQLDPTKLNVKDPGEPYFEEVTTATDIVSGVGMTIFNEKWYIGLSIPDIIPYKGLTTGDNLQRSFMPQIYLAGGMNVELSYNVFFRPSLFVYYGKDITPGFELTSNFILKDKLSAGLGYRYSSAYILMLGYKFSDNFSIGYSYDWDIHDLHRYNKGTHELFLRFEFDTKNERVRFQSPRFF